MSELGIGGAFRANFLGASPKWYKTTIVAFLVINPILFYTVGPFITGWLLIAEFIFTLALALKCYPLPSGGLLAIEAVILKMTSPETVYMEVANNLPVILLLIFMVAGIYFMKSLLLFVFTRLIVSTKSKVILSLLFCFMGAFLSAFLDALTVTAVIISVAYGFYAIYHKYVSKIKAGDASHALSDDSKIPENEKKDLDQFRGFLRNIMMHGAVGTALGGAMTLVGEPQNLLIGSIMNWSFFDFFHWSSPVSVPVLLMGLTTCILLELTHFMGYGYQLPDSVRAVLEAEVRQSSEKLTPRIKMQYIVQGVVGVLLIVALALHWAEVGLIGLSVIILLSAFNGSIEEHDFGHAFTEALPFTALLVVFFSIVGVIHDQHLFKPIIDYVLTMGGNNQLIAFFVANGVLSAISDNVFVATVYITEVQKAFADGLISAEQFNKLAVAVNMGTNIPSVATPNGQAAFLFLLTSALAPVIRLSYLEMMKLALPYTITMTAVGLLATKYLL